MLIFVLNLKTESRLFNVIHVSLMGQEVSPAVLLGECFSYIDELKVKFELFKVNVPEPQ